MFEFDAGKLIIIGIVALIVIGPKELPRVMRHLGEAVAKMRHMAAEFRSQFMDALRESELDEVKSSVEKLAESAKTGAGSDPLAQIKAELTQALDAAEKPAELPGAGVKAMAVPLELESPRHLAALPEMNDTLAVAGASSPGSGTAPMSTEPRPAAGRAIDAEMRALADALAAEIGEAAPVSAGADHVKAPVRR